MAQKLVFKRGESVSFNVSGDTVVGVVVSGQPGHKGRIVVRNALTGHACMVHPSNINVKFTSLKLN